jgi:hypothetical protein
MRHGVTNKFTTGHFSLRDSFDIPAGTPVFFGLPDCNGEPFPHWALDEKTAFALSGNAHDSTNRFVVVHSDHVTEKEGVKT